MMNAGEQQDLVVLTADKDMEFAIRGIITRHKSLQIREIDAKFLVHSKHDPGCLRDPISLLRLYCKSHRYALVLFDHEGSGGENRKREDLETEIEAVLSKNGWADRAAAIVIEPELEAWVWSTSSRVDEKLGWQNRSPKLRDWLQKETDFWLPDTPKPARPKEAMQESLYKAGKARSSSIFEEIAKSVSLKGCGDPAFAKLTSKLTEWFGV